MLKQFGWLAILVFMLCASVVRAEENDDSYRNLKPFVGKHHKGVDTQTIKSKVMCGYQGWFATPGDGAGRGWVHYNGPKGVFKPGICTIDIWPDMSEMEKDEKYPTPFKHKDGSTAYVFSPYNPKTVMRHFAWMKEAGIDGVDRAFIGEVTDDREVAVSDAERGAGLVDEVADDLVVGIQVDDALVGQRAEGGAVAGEYHAPEAPEGCIRLVRDVPGRERAAQKADFTPGRVRQVTSKVDGPVRKDGNRALVVHGIGHDGQRGAGHVGEAAGVGERGAVVAVDAQVVAVASDVALVHNRGIGFNVAAAHDRAGCVIVERSGDIEFHLVLQPDFALAAEVPAACVALLDPGLADHTHGAVGVAEEVTFDEAPFKQHILVIVNGARDVRLTKAEPALIDDVGLEFQVFQIEVAKVKDAVIHDHLARTRVVRTDVYFASTS